MDKLRVIYTEAAKYSCLENLQDSGSLGMGTTLNLDYTGWQECEPGHYFGPTVRQSYLVHVVEKGQGHLQTQYGEYNLSEGQAFVIFPGEETFYQADRENPWKYYWVGFHGYKAKEYFDNLGITQKNPVIELTDTKDLVFCVKELLRACQLTYANEIIRMGYMVSFLGFLESNRKKDFAEEKEYHYPANTYVQYAIDYIKYHYKEKVKIDEIAEFIGINRSYLTRSFKKETNMSPQEFLIQYRLEKAAGMLKKTEESVSLIASKVGYMDQIAFSKAFKEKYGLSPQKYRQEPEDLLLQYARREGMDHVKL